MDVQTRIDEGHVFSDEDYIFNVKWTVNDLVKKGYSEEVILSWEESELWNYYARILLNELSQEFHQKLQQ